MKTNILLIIAIFFSFSVHAQNQPVVLAIDGVNTTFQSGLSLPYWLKAGQTLNLVANACSVSIMEFTEDTTALKYSRVISLNSLQTVPSGKIWKIEAIGTTIIPFDPMAPIFISPQTFSSPGTYTWTVPYHVFSICVSVVGGGGKGGEGFWTFIYPYNNPAYSNYQPSSGYGHFGGGGGGGGYGYQCFSVVPGTTYTVTVGGPSGTSSVGSLISATGGAPGFDADSTSNGAGGAGGTSTATFNASGFSGSAVVTYGSFGTGGLSGTNVNGSVGNGGNGGGLYHNGSGPYPTSLTPAIQGQPGKVIISW